MELSCTGSNPAGLVGWVRFRIPPVWGSRALPLVVLEGESFEIGVGLAVAWAASVVTLEGDATDIGSDSTGVSVLSQDNVIRKRSTTTITNGFSGIDFDT